MDRVEKILLSVTSAIMISILLIAGRAMYVTSECMRLGYTRGEIVGGLASYCIAREDQTDVVLPLEEARKRPRVPR